MHRGSLQNFNTVKLEQNFFQGEGNKEADDLEDQPQVEEIEIGPASSSNKQRLAKIAKLQKDMEASSKQKHERSAIALKKRPIVGED